MTNDKIIMTTIYHCPDSKCNKEYDYWRDAYECCQETITSEYRYECQSCGNEYGDSDEANNCCKPDSGYSTYEKYRCPICDNGFGDSEDAEVCCNDSPKSSDVIICSICEKVHDTEALAMNCYLDCVLKQEPEQEGEVL